MLHDVNLRLIAENASFKTNHLEGMLNASVIVTNASSADWHSWNGDGVASLRDGVLWDVPLFGILSPALNAVSPGLGSSRATAAEGKFSITNGVIYTDSLSIGLPLSRLQFVGTVDLKQNVNAPRDRPTTAQHPRYWFDRQHAVMAGRQTIRISVLTAR